MAEFTSRDGLLTPIAPLVIHCHGVIVSWIRLETTLLSLREFDSKYVLQLSEVSAELNQRYVRQQANATRLAVLAAVLRRSWP